MRYFSKLSVTLRLITFSLCPAFSAVRSCAVSELFDGVRAGLPEGSSGKPEWHDGRRGKYLLMVPGALTLAAPFVLYRLKRWGYSACRIAGDSEGLRIEMRR